MAGNVWVLAEQWRGRLSEITFEVLALGRELASGLGVELEAVLLGHHAAELAGQLGAADRVLAADHPSLAEPVADEYCEALAQLIKAKQPCCVLVPASNVLLDVGALLPARLDAPFVNWCKDVRAEDGKLRARALLYGGKMEAICDTKGEPVILAIQPGTRPAEQGRVARSAPLEEVQVTLANAPRVRLLEYVEPEPGDVDITQQEILVSVGRGIQTKDNISLAEELAAALGGAVSGSRPIIDQGWLPLSRQVGKSGASVKPKLYLALGISGAPEHVEGMKNAALIVAVNTDPTAPIFNVAHYGVVAEIVELVPSLTEEVARRRGARDV